MNATEDRNVDPREGEADQDKNAEHSSNSVATGGPSLQEPSVPLLLLAIELGGLLICACGGSDGIRRLSVARSARRSLGEATHRHCAQLARARLRAQPQPERFMGSGRERSRCSCRWRRPAWSANVRSAKRRDPISGLPRPSFLRPRSSRGRSNGQPRGAEDRDSVEHSRTARTNLPQLQSDGPAACRGRGAGSETLSNEKGCVPSGRT